MTVPALDSCSGARSGAPVPTLPYDRMAALRIAAGPFAGHTIEVRDEVVIGREDVDVVIDDAEVSRRHTAVRQLPGALEVEDLGSSNGTFIDGERIEGAIRVADGARIQLGGTVLEVEGVSAAQPTVATAREVTIVSDVRLRPAARIHEPGQGAQKSASPVLPVGVFTAPERRHRRGAASRRWAPVLLSFGTVVLVAVALVIYFATR